MNAHVALNFAPRATARPVRTTATRKLVRARVLPALRPIIVRHIAFAPSTCARIETVLMGASFLALAVLAITMEAVGTSLF